MRAPPDLCFGFFGADAAQQFEVVPEFLRRLAEALIGHQHGAREIIAEGDEQQVACFRVGGLQPVDDAFDQGMMRQSRDLGGELEAAPGRQQGFGQQDAAAMRIVAPERVGHDMHGHHFHRDALLLREVLGQAPEQIVAIQPGFLPERFGRVFQLREMIGLALVHVAHRLDRGERLVRR